MVVVFIINSDRQRDQTGDVTSGLNSTGLDRVENPQTQISTFPESKLMLHACSCATLAAYSWTENILKWPTQQICHFYSYCSDNSHILCLHCSNVVKFYNFRLKSLWSYQIKIKSRSKHSSVVDRTKLRYLKHERYIIAAIIAGAVWGYAEIAHYVT